MGFRTLVAPPDHFTVTDRDERFEVLLTSLGGADDEDLEREGQRLSPRCAQIVTKAQPTNVRDAARSW